MEGLYAGYLGFHLGIVALTSSYSRLRKSISWVNASVLASRSDLRR